MPVTAQWRFGAGPIGSWERLSNSAAQSLSRAGAALQAFRAVYRSLAARKDLGQTRQDSSAIRWCVGMRAANLLIEELDDSSGSSSENARGGYAGTVGQAGGAGNFGRGVLHGFRGWQHRHSSCRVRPAVHFTENAAGKPAPSGVGRNGGLLMRSRATPEWSR